MLQKFIQKLREIVPLGLRKRIGPYIAYIVYVINVYFRKNRKRPHVLSLDNSIDKIKNENLSFIRFGDGEMSAICHHDLAFQEKNTAMAQRLSEVLQSNHKGLLICIPGMFENLRALNKIPFWFSVHHMFKYGHRWNNLLSGNQIYGDTFITRPYLTFKDKSHCGRIFSKMISLWEGKDVVLIEGSKSRLGVGNDLFNKVKSLGRILCPPENAFSKYEEIKNEALKISKDKIILLSIGPTAKILAYDLFLLGYRVMDIGHIDMEYEMFLRNKDTIVKVKYKYFNEIEERNPEECTDEVYLSQILAKIN